MSSMEDLGCPRIPLQDIKLATNNFSDDKYISHGGFGWVYKGELPVSKKKVMVAVKRLDPRYGQGATEFGKEIQLLSHYKHGNLVHLLGFSDEDNEKILVYEYLSNTSLDVHISKPCLSWIDRLIICIGVARGLKYLQDPGRTKQILFHGDIKSANILLDAKWNAKISDFGLSNFVPASQGLSSCFSTVVGTPGYVDPDYLETGLLTKESDIYSFGVVLFEVLCGKLGVNYNDGHPILLSRLARKCYEEKKMHTIVLDCLKEQISPCCLDKFSTIAYQCLQRGHDKRPPIAKIVKQLKAILQCQMARDILNGKKVKSHTLFHQIEHQKTRMFMEEHWSDVKTNGLRFVQHWHI